MSQPTRKMVCIGWRAILMVDPKREHDVVKQEAFGRKSGGSYVLGRS